LKKNSGRGSQRAWRQDELIGCKSPVVKWLWLWLKLGCVYDHITKLRRTQAEVVLKHVNQHVCLVLDKHKPGIGSIRGLSLASVRPTTVKLTICSFRVVA
jgi:hypothetical protein